MNAPIPAQEIKRLERLKFYRVLDTPQEDAFDAITRLAASILGTPIALISLIDEHRQWFKSKVGLDVQETPREMAFCAHAIMDTEVFVVPDARSNPAFSNNPLVTGDPNIRFYAGAPLTTVDGLNLGTVCVIDRKPREISPEQSRMLKDLAQLVVNEFELRVAGRLALEDLAEQRQTEQIKSQFVADMNHELRTPLTSIIGSLSLLKSGMAGALPDKAVEMVAIAERNSNQLLALVNDLLDTAKFEAGKIQLDLRPTDLDRLIREGIENLTDYAGSRGVIYRYSAAANSRAVVHGDAGRLTQVMNNLLSNAAKFSPDQGTVEVKLTAESGGFTVSVIDHGSGVPDDLTPELFKKFVQAKTAGKPKMPGTGLGLSIAKAIIDAHGGEIGYRREPGKGAHFWFRLPKL